MSKKLLLVAIAAVGISACGGHGATPSAPLDPMQSASQPAADLAVQATAASVPTGWAATATNALPLANATNLGAVPSTTRMTIRVGLKLRNLATLKYDVAHNQEIADGSFMSSFAPTPAQANQVTSYLISKGFSNIAVEPNNAIVTASGTAAQVESAFHTTLNRYSQNGKTVFANPTPAYVPTALSGVVLAVLGLNDVQAFTVKPKITACIGGVTNPCLRFYDPATFRKAYHATSTGTYTDNDAAITPVAIMAEGNLTGAISDFHYNETKFGLPQATVIVKQVGLASPDTAGSDEWTLDMTYSTGIAGKVKDVYVYDTTSLTDSDVALEYSHWVTDHLTNIGNSSFGECEIFPYLDGAMLVDDELFLEGAAHGQTMFASTGDTGGYCSVGVPPNGVPGGAPFVAYPAASPYVTAVGGTDLFTNADGTYKGETAWEAGGGGLSQFEYAPYWEAEEQPVAAHQSMRGTPDIAFDASLETGAILYLGGTEYTIGGTSLASPLAAGTWAMMQSSHYNGLGFAPPRLYRLFSLSGSGTPTTGPPPTLTRGPFHDIIVGSNGNPLGTAAPGYDYATGLGSLDVLNACSLIAKALP